MPGATTVQDGPLAVPPARLRFGVDLPYEKLRAPETRPWTVPRGELLARLAQGHDRPLILVTAPAGYGKTTLLTQWSRQCAHPCAWVTLDRTDSAPDRLADSIMSALATIGIQPGARRSFALVLDDAQVLPAAVLSDAVLGILEWLPSGSQLAVSSRHELVLPLSRMRAQRLMVEIGADDLSMLPREAASLLRTAGLETEGAPAQALVARAEGWPVALELAGLSSLRRADPADAAAGVGGDDHVIAEYFRAEILGSLPAATVRFLIHTSVLDRLSGPVCDAVLGRRRSATQLAELVRGNVPLTPVDPSHEWYCLNPLFRDMLRTELRRSEPEMVPVLHGRAEAWYRAAGDVDRALDHAMAGEDLDYAGRLLWKHLPRYLGNGRSLDVARWVTLADVDRVGRSAAFALAAAHSSLALGGLADAEQWARTAAVRLSEAPARATASEGAGVLLIQAWAARPSAGAMGDLAAQAYEQLRDDSPWRASCCLLRGSSALLTGAEADAEWWLQEGVDRGAVVAPDAASLCLAQLAVVAAERGEAVAASDLAGRAREMVAEHGLTIAPASALVFAVCAAAAMREGRVDEAKAAVSECRTLLELQDDALAWLGAETRIVLARVSLALGDVAAARGLLADASRLARRTRDVVVFERWFDDAWDQFDERAESSLAGVASLTTAELRVLRFLPTHYSFHEIAQRLHVSSNTVKTHVHAVYRKLDASSRSEAVAHATQAGLLGG
ncbi:MAG: LuxR C-terminal-related transcriptional regulator [Solirubrobacteraceae bacterium]